MCYPIVIHKDRKSDYGVIVPDLPGCFSAGDTLDDAIRSSREAILCHLEGMLEDGESIPASQTIQFHQSNPDYADGIWAIVEVNLREITGKSKRVDVTLPNKIIRKIDNAAKRAGLSRSAYIAEIASRAQL